MLPKGVLFAVVAVVAVLIIVLGADMLRPEPQPRSSPEVGITGQNSTPLPRTPKPDETLTPKQIEDLGRYRR